MNWRRARLAAECGVVGISVSPERVENCPGTFTWYWWSFGSTLLGMTDPCGRDDAWYGGLASGGGRDRITWPPIYPPSNSLPRGGRTGHGCGD